MVELFVERTYRPALTRDRVLAMGEGAAGCFNLYRIQWLESLLAADGGTMICHFRAPDAESLRMALRVTDGAVPPLWPGSVHTAPGATPGEGNVVVERHFDTPVTLAGIQALEDASAHCLESRRVRFERTFFSRDGTRMICIYRAPDAESVRQAQRQAGMPVARVWAFQRIAPDALRH